MPTYKLFYMNGKGRGETTRMLFKLAGIPFEDERITDEQFEKKEWTARTPYNQLPVLEVDGEVYAQSHAIERFVAKRTGYYGKDDLEDMRKDMYVDLCDSFILALEQSCTPIFSNPKMEEQTKMDIGKKFIEETAPPILKNIEKSLQANGHFIGNQISWPDVLLFNVMELPETAECHAVSFDPYPRMRKLKENILKTPALAAWIKERPKTAY